MKKDVLIGTLFFIFVMLGGLGLILELENRANQREAEAEARCAEFADGDPWFVELERGFGSDDWVCTVTPEDGEWQQIAWPE